MATVTNKSMHEWTPVQEGDTLVYDDDPVKLAREGKFVPHTQANIDALCTHIRKLEAALLEQTLEALEGP